MNQYVGTVPFTIQLVIYIYISMHSVVATQIFFIFTPKLGEDEPILTSIFFKGVGSTANY